MLQKKGSVVTSKSTGRLSRVAGPGGRGAIHFDDDGAASLATAAEGSSEDGACVFVFNVRGTFC